MKLPKKAPSHGKLLNDALHQDQKFLFRHDEPAIKQLIERANQESWNWEECGYHLGNSGLTKEQLWALVKLARSPGRQEIPLRDGAGKPFSFRLPPTAGRILHLADKYLGGSLESSFPQIDSSVDRQRYLITSLTEEAVASSQLEGAVVTREVAKEMLRSKRAPRNHDERMIVNNYRAIQMLKERVAQPLTIPLLFEIQAMLTEGTLEKPDASGRFRRPEENITVWDDEDQQVLHTPPPAEELSQRMEGLCAFANARSKTPEGFIHPVVRAITLHFWLAYDHPFVDGNGRTARALFYWSMLREGYWLVEYLTISSIIREQPKQYTRAFLNTEIDDNDLTYFLLYHLRVIERSIEAFRKYLDRKLSERKRGSAIVRSGRFNHRQEAILLKALSAPETRFTYEAHASAHGVTLATGRSDLLGLEGMGLLRGNRAGRRFEFVAVPNLEARLQRMAQA